MGFRKFHLKKQLTAVIVLLMVLSLSGCSDLGYYAQCAQGHLKVMARTRPIARVVADPQTSPEVRQQLEKVSLMRDFAVTDLGLPDNDSYRRYADIDRPFVVWNVVATREFSLEAKQWCFPVAGCVSYKGYFEQAGAEQLAERLRAENYDVDLYGVKAYSTLKWFDDPILNTFISSSDARLAGLLFHELAHQLIYVADDSPFNEAFAMTVQIEGVHRWFQQHSNPEEWQRFLYHQAQVQLFQNYLNNIREQLIALYQREMPITEMREEKQRLITAALAQFEALKATGQLGSSFDRWMEPGLNNARLAGVATYRELIPGFQAMLKQCHGDLECFYARVRVLSKLPKDERLSQLRAASQPTLAMHYENGV